MAPFFMDGAQLPQGYNHFEETDFTFYHSVCRNYCHFKVAQIGFYGLMFL